MKIIRITFLLIFSFSLFYQNIYGMDDNLNNPYVDYSIMQSVLGHFSCSYLIDTLSLLHQKDLKIENNFIIITRNDEVIWESPPAPIWKILLADVNGNGDNELALCLYKEEPYDPKKDNRLHIYVWNDGYVKALWRGTFLSKPFINLTFGNLNEDNAEELISIERSRMEKEKIYLCMYSWSGFGFDLITERIIDFIPTDIIIT